MRFAIKIEEKKKKKKEKKKEKYTSYRTLSNRVAITTDYRRPFICRSIVNLDVFKIDASQSFERIPAGRLSRSSRWNARDSIMLFNFNRKKRKKNNAMIRDRRNERKKKRKKKKKRTRAVQSRVAEKLLVTTRRCHHLSVSPENKNKKKKRRKGRRRRRKKRKQKAKLPLVKHRSHRSTTIAATYRPTISPPTTIYR